MLIRFTLHAYGFIHLINQLHVYLLKINELSINNIRNAILYTNIVALSVSNKHILNMKLRNTSFLLQQKVGTSRVRLLSYF